MGKPKAAAPAEVPPPVAPKPAAAENTLRALITAKIADHKAEIAALEAHLASGAAWLEHAGGRAKELAAEAGFDINRLINKLRARL